MSDNFTFNVTGNNSQNIAKNEGQVSQTISLNNDPWKEAEEAATEPKVIEAVQSIRGIVESYPRESMEPAEEDKTRLEKALGVLKKHGPKVGKIATKVALSFPISKPLKVLIEAAQAEYG